MSKVLKIILTVLTLVFTFNYYLHLLCNYACIFIHFNAVVIHYNLLPTQLEIISKSYYAT